MTSKSALILGTVLATVVNAGAVDAQTSEAKRKGLWGAGIGAIAGGLIGGDWEDAAVGAMAGGGLGYMAGNEDDKRRAQAQAAAERRARAQAQVTNNPQTAYRPPATNQLVGSTWQVISLVSDEPYPEYASMVVTFPSNSKLSTMAVHKDGTTETWVENYRIVEDVMVVSGKDPKTGKSYVFNFKYSVDGDQFIAVAPESRVVMERVQ